MNIIEEIGRIREMAPVSDPSDLFALVEDELSTALSSYWASAGRILEGGTVRVLDPPEGFLSLERNFFSALFLYSYHRAGISRSRRILYAAINQCLRGMVTGCDNLLDDEYKKTVETNLPAEAVRFRSVMDIMISEQVMFELLFEEFQEGGLDAHQILNSGRITLAALTRSGSQEAAEEGGIREILPPEQVLDRVHHFKTGLLFQSPWAIPQMIEGLREETVTTLLNALYRIGMGCQVMDDMVDLSRDVLSRRHNYVASLLFHGPDRRAWERLASSAGAHSDNGRDLLMEFPHAMARAARTAESLLEHGLGDLLSVEHRDLVHPAIMFLSRRIGSERMMGLD